MKKQNTKKSFERVLFESFHESNPEGAIAPKWENQTKEARLAWINVAHTSIDYFLAKTSVGSDVCHKCLYCGK